MIRKLIIANGRTEREILLVGNITIGRDPACHVSDPDPLLSRRHAEILANIHGVSIRDLDSRNGVLVNGEKTHEQVLLPGDVVQMGHLQLRYVEENVRVADSRASRGRDPRRHTPPPPPAPSAYERERFRPEPTPRPTPKPTPRRWTPEPTPLPGRRSTAPPVPQMPPQPRAQNFTPVPRGRAAFDETIPGPRPGRGQEAFDQTMAAPRSVHHDTTLGHMPADLDATIMAPMPTREPSGIHRRPGQDATMLGNALSPDTMIGPGDSTFASALAHLSGLANPDNEQVRPGPGAHLVANAELTVTDATPACAELLGIPDEELIGDSLTDVFLRGVRCAYAEPNSVLSLSISRGAHGSIAVTFTLDKTGGTE